jgi:catechol 2,3-dioxygenase-like lactoylglutathione lyase family enzyme
MSKLDHVSIATRDWRVSRDWYVRWTMWMRCTRDFQPLA